MYGTALRLQRLLVASPEVSTRCTHACAFMLAKCHHSARYVCVLPAQGTAAASSSASHLLYIRIFGNWYLVFGIWYFVFVYLVFGIWYLVFGIWYSHIWYLVFGILYLVFGTSYLAFGIWYLVFGIS